MMNMTLAKQEEIAEQKRMKELQAKCDMANAQVMKENKKRSIKEKLYFRGLCLKGLVTGKI